MVSKGVLIAYVASAAFGLRCLTRNLCSTIGSTIGRSSSPKTVESTSSPAALHLRRFHLFISSPSSSSSPPSSPRVAPLSNKPQITFLFPHNKSFLLHHRAPNILNGCLLNVACRCHHCRWLNHRQRAWPCKGHQILCLLGKEGLDLSILVLNNNAAACSLFSCFHIGNLLVVFIVHLKMQ